VRKNEGFHYCSKCNHLFPLSVLGRALDELSSENPNVNFDAYVKVTCPKCGKIDFATEKKFFGCMNAKTLYFIVAAMLLGMIVFVVLQLFINLM